MFVAAIVLDDEVLGEAQKSLLLAEVGRDS